MILSSLEFVVLLPIVIAIYWLLGNRRLQLVFVGAFTALFIAFSGRFHLYVLLFVIGAIALVVATANRAAQHRRRWLRIGIVVLVVILCFFKYLGWVVRSLGLYFPQLPQPLGISYYTFILIGFLLDTGSKGPALSATRLPSLLLFFPFLSSGPIVRLRSWSNQVSRRRKPRVMRNVTIGTQLFLAGVFKKVLIADAIAISTAPVWANPSEYSKAAVAMAIAGFYVQLYADFSGYTDMARGVARMMGYHLPINFKAPYLAATPTEFWGRWHMSLTGWIRDYVFTPVSLVAWRRAPRRVRPLVTFALVVFLMTLVGLWHGASGTLVLFGALHGVLMGIWYSVVGTGKRLTRPQRIASWALFQFLLMLSMTIFRADSVRSAWDMTRGTLFNSGSNTLTDAAVGLVLAGAAVFVIQRFELHPSRLIAKMRADLRLFPLLVGLVLGVMYMKGLTLEGVWISPADPFFNQGQEKFIYLQF